MLAHEKARQSETWGEMARAVFRSSSPLQGISEDTMARVRARQVYAISSLTVPMMLANIINALALLFVLDASGQSSPAVVIWTFVAVSFAILTIYTWYRRTRYPFPERLRRKTARRVVANAALLGAVWVIPGLFFLPVTTGLAQAFLIALAAGMIAGGSMALYPLPAAALTYSAVIAIGSFIGFSSTGDISVVGFAMVTLAFFFIVATTVTRHAEVFVSEFVGRLELDEKNALIEKLLNEVRAQANDERVKSERRLAEAQKMEAIGQLTGGIAHDFNNLLAAIQGHAELIELEQRIDKSLTQPILRSTRRGSELVRGLMSIARKQPLKNQSVDVRQMIDLMAPLLKRTLGGRVVIDKHVPSDLWPAYADIVHLESAVLNLALNARDAMPDGGTLSLECSNADSRTSEILGEIDGVSGEFVCVAVTDNGHGMSAEVRKRAVEPFFTTKKVGDGSGLGLSSVEGFCGQSGGHLWIESDEGVGSTIYMFLPRAEDVLSDDDKAEAYGAILPCGRGEHLLVVEDDEDVRHLTTTMLRSLNYQASWSPTADAALQLIRSGEGFDMVLVDVRLPGKLNGLQLAEIVGRESPETRIVVYSGYPEVDNRNPQGIPFPFLTKPFSRSDLAKTVAMALD